MEDRWKKLSLAAATTMCAATLMGCGSSRVAATGNGACDPGITDDTIKLGQSSLQSGAGAAYKPFATTPAAFFEELNASGGVEFADGTKRKIEFISLDDNYDPARSVGNVKKLIERDQVFALYQNTGTSSILAQIGYTTKAGVPLLFAGSGADDLRAMYQEGKALIAASALPSVRFENKVFVDAIQTSNPSAKIAILYPNDGLGKGQLENLHEFVDGTELQIVAEESYELTAPTVDSQVTKVRQSNADVFMHLGTGTAVTGALKKLNELGWQPEKWVISSSIDPATIIKPAGEGAAENLHSVAWIYGVADESNDDVTGVKKWQEWAEEHGQDPRNQMGAISYHDAQLFVQILANMEGCTRSDLFEAARSTSGMTSDLGLPGLTFGATEDNPSSVNSMALMAWQDDHWVYGDVISGAGE